MGLMGTRLKLSKPYTIEELYELIKNETFEAGVPTMANHGPTKWIVFPRMDRNNQVVIGGNNGKFYAQRSIQPIGLDNAAENVIFSSWSNGLSDFTAVFGKTKKRCEQLADEVAKQINSMNL